LSYNYFTGDVPIFGSAHLEILHVHGNGFSGSIPVKIRDMMNLNELFLHNNKLFGTLTSEIGKLVNISKITLSYNKIKGTIPTEIGQLKQLTLLHLHSNELVGTADHFGNHNIESFTSDCGNTATTESLVECETCTECCNQDEECITETRTWPRDGLKILNSSLDLPSAGSVFILAFVSSLLMIFVAMILHLFKDTLPKSSYVYEGDRFQKDSVYRFFLSSNKLGWFVAIMTIMFQIWVTYTFFNAGDRTAKMNDWAFSVICPNDSIECSDTRQVTKVGWITFSIILICFTLSDIIDGIYLFYESSTAKEIDIKGVFFGVILTSVPMMCIVASIIYLYATSISNAALLKDSVAILFLSDIDEKVFRIVLRFNSSWVDKIEENIASRPNAPSILNASLQTHEVIHDRDNVTLDISNDESVQNECINDLGSVNTEETNVVSHLKLLTREIEEMKIERQNERALMFEMWSVLIAQYTRIDCSEDIDVKSESSVTEDNRSNSEYTRSSHGSKKGKLTEVSTTDLKLSSRHDRILNFHSKMKAYYEMSNRSCTS
jgi:hypothetical protein